MIPDGTTVTKRGGEKKYTLTREVRVYGEDGHDIGSSVYASSNEVLLVADTSINRIPAKTELLADCEVEGIKVLD